ncbi:hypothetical protein AMQ68_17495 [Chryseobacterium sp. ERMR1:04]|nr:hypothetical protein AMQ68_17495 [Chryseobacterium sp. ERMR1:04]
MFLLFSEAFRIPPVVGVYLQVKGTIYIKGEVEYKIPNWRLRIFTEWQRNIMKEYLFFVLVKSFVFSIFVRI